MNSAQLTWVCGFFFFTWVYHWPFWLAFTWPFVVLSYLVPGLRALGG